MGRLQCDAPAEKRKVLYIDTEQSKGYGMACCE